ncbi:MAG: MgtC/SapB family protein [Limnochordia bacterium]|nr:MgtC/SapB family protein [Limnochordia bacterium]
MEITNFEIAVRLILALVLGGLIGLERESMGRPAGFRTHILVSVGSALIMIMSAYAFAESLLDYDPGRIAAQVVSGIGFLGAGTIMREGANVRGLTTAASLWTVAGIGLAVGSGFYFAAVLATLLVVLTLVVLNQLEWNYLSTKHEILTLLIQDTPGQLARVFAVLAKYDVDVFNVELSSDDAGEAKLDLEVEISQKFSRVKIIEDLVSTPGVKRASYK